MNEFPLTNLGRRFEHRILRQLNWFKPQSQAFGLELMSSADFLDTDFRLEWLVNGILVAGQPALVGGAKRL